VVQDFVNFILHPQPSHFRWTVSNNTHDLWFIWRARWEKILNKRHRLYGKLASAPCNYSWKPEIQGTKLVNFAGDDQNPRTTTQLEELDEQSTTMAEQQQPVQEVKCRVQHNQLCNQRQKMLQALFKRKL
jgi:hypothetical protein